MKTKLAMNQLKIIRRLIYSLPNQNTKPLVHSNTANTSTDELCQSLTDLPSTMYSSWNINSTWNSKFKMKIQIDHYPSSSASFTAPVTMLSLERSPIMLGLGKKKKVKRQQILRDLVTFRWVNCQKLNKFMDCTAKESNI